VPPKHYAPQLSLYIRPSPIGLPHSIVGRDSSVSGATRYGLDGPGIECRWGRDFPNPSRPALHNEYWSMPGVKRPGRGVYHPPQSSALVKKRSIPLLHPWAFVACFRMTSTFALPLPHSTFKSTRVKICCVMNSEALENKYIRVTVFICGLCCVMWLYYGYVIFIIMLCVLC
jgi:hypothetical protein